MGNTFLMQRRHVNQGVNGLDASVASIEPPDAHWPHEQIPEAVVDGLEADPFPAQHPGYIPVTPATGDVAVWQHTPEQIVLGIGELGHYFRIRPWGVLIVHRRGLITPKGLVRALVVVDVKIALEGALLLLEVGLNTTAALKGAVQSLMPRILLRTSGLDTLRNDAQLDPPQREPGKTAQATGTKGLAVVGADRPRQPIGAKRTLARQACVRVSAAPKPLAAQEVATDGIAQRKRIAKLAVAHAKLPLEVRTPQVVGCYGLHEGRPVRGGVALAFACLDQTGTLKHFGSRRGRRQWQMRHSSLQPVQHRDRPPVRMALAHSYDLHRRQFAHRLGMVMRCTRTLFETRFTVSAVALQKLVSRLAANSKNTAQLADGALPALNLQYKSQPFVHGTGLLPRHWQALPARMLSTCYPCRRISVTNVAG